MNLPAHLAKHLRDVYFGGNWSSSNLKDQLADVNWQQATTPIYGLNTIATLVYHMTCYVDGVLKVFQGGPLETKDKLSFNHPPIESPEDWGKMLDKIWSDVEAFAQLIEVLPEEKAWEPFVEEKYGNYFRNITGIIEHLHYHLGQVVIIKKILQQQEANS